jgi:hypothetical protein
MMAGAFSTASASTVYYNTFNAYSSNIVSDVDNGQPDGVGAMVIF